MSKSPFTPGPPACTSEHEDAARQVMEALAARTMPPCWCAWYRWAKARLCASGAEGAAAAAAGEPLGAHIAARARLPTAARRSSGPREWRMTVVALSEQVAVAAAAECDVSARRGASGGPHANR